MATKTYGTTNTAWEPRVIGFNGYLVSSFTPDDWGGNLNPQESRALYVVTRIVIYARAADADAPAGSRTVKVVMGRTPGGTDKASSSAYNTFSGSASLGSGYAYFAGSADAVIGSTTEYYAGALATSSSGVMSTRTPPGSSPGDSVYANSVESANSQQYLSLDYYGLPNAPSQISASTGGQNSVNVTFSQVAASGVATSADGYTVQYKKSIDASWTNFTSTSGYPLAGISVTGLEAGTAYDFRVAAYDATIRSVVSDSTGPWSSTASATTESGTPPVPAPTWSGSFNSGQVNTTYIQDFSRATGHDTSYGPIEITSGSLPPGLSGSASGEYFYVSGTPTTAGTYPFNLTAENSGGESTAGFSITISALPAPSWVDQTLSSTATVGVRYLDYLSATNVDSWSYGGALPPGIGFFNGTLDGYPTTVGSYTFTVYASNAVDTAQKTFTITVDSALLNGGSRMTGSSTSTSITTYKRYNGSSWTDLTIAKRFNGSSWEDI